jgi:hypothetical protein
MGVGMSRDEEMRVDRARGMKLREIAEKYGVSRQRVYQIVGKKDVSRGMPLSSIPNPVTPLSATGPVTYTVDMPEDE